MKHKTWFRLVLQAIGVMLIGFAIPGFVRDIGGYFMWRWFMPSAPGVGWMPTTSEEIMQIAIQALPSLVQLSFGIYLLTGGAWILNKVIPSNRPYCPECGYDLTHNSGEKCVECGVTLPEKPAV